jgi:hypothetical protein
MLLKPGTTAPYVDRVSASEMIHSSVALGVGDSDRNPVLTDHAQGIHQCNPFLSRISVSNRYSQIGDDHRRRNI